MSVSANTYDIGDIAVLYAAFTSPTSGAAVMPATVVCRVQNGYGTVVATYIYGAGALTAVGSGIFEVQQAIDGPGTWRYRFEGYTPAAAEEFSFHVRASAFA